MQITTVSRTQRRNWDCPKCGGMLWWDDKTTWITGKKVGRKHWWNAMGRCREDCPEAEHVHIRDYCFTGCGFEQMRVRPIEKDED